MRREAYEVTLDVDVRYRVEFRQQRGQIVEFVVQLEFGQDQPRPVIRYDTAHGFAHCDRYRADGTRSIHEPMSTTDFNDAMTTAIEDVLENWEAYVKGFRRRRS